MEFWNNIVNTALLGTDKKQLRADELIPDVAAAIAAITDARQLDKEEQFLAVAAVAFNYRQCGVMPYNNEAATTTVATAETLPYCSKVATKLLREILEEDARELLNLWLRLCTKKGLIVSPEIIPTLLNKGAENKKIRNLIVQCGGQRSIWLSDFNNKWKYVKAAAEAINNPAGTKSTDEQDLTAMWETGNPEERKEALQLARAADPAKALTMLIQTWATENVNTKVELLRFLEPGISEGDKEWLETLVTDKSQKVKEGALALLKLIGTSAVMQRYQQIVQPIVQLKTEKILLGLSKKTTLQIALPAQFDEDIFKTGIEKYSDKNFTEHEFTLLQLIAAVPPSFWETQLNTTPQEIITYFNKEENSKKYLPALLKAAIKFKDTKWAIEFTKPGMPFDPAALPLLPQTIQDEVMVSHLAADKVIPYAVLLSKEWSVPLARMILKEAAMLPYNYNKPFFKDNITRIPFAILEELAAMPTNGNYQKNLWGSHVTYINKIYNLKQNILNAFA